MQARRASAPAARAGGAAPPLDRPPAPAAGAPLRGGRRATRSLAALALGAALALAACGMPPNGLHAFGVHLAGPQGFEVEGNRILGPDGRPFLVHGVDRPSLEWSPNGVALSAQDFALMRSWGANTVRIALDQDFWLSTSCRADPAYPATVARAVRWAEAAGLVVILDLHWSDEGQDNRPGTLFCPVTPAQQQMADDNSLTFWRQVATAYRNDPRVWFELYNEPHDVSWPVWRNGGTVSDTTSHLQWQAAGMQQLYDAVRSTGARNIVLVGGLAWASELRGLPQYALQGYNIVYDAHTYYEGGSRDPIAAWNANFGFVAKTRPVVVTEFGQFDCGSDFVQNFIDYAREHGIGWTAWAWYPGGCKFPSLIANWNGTPTAAGRAVQAALQSSRTSG